MSQAGAQLLERLRKALAIEAAGHVPAASCPTPEAIWDVAHQAASLSRRRQVVHHVIACGVCTEAWRLAYDLRSDGTERRAATSIRPVSTGWWWGLAAAAAAVAVAGILLQLRPVTADRQGTEFRSAPAGALSSRLPAGATLPREAFVLRWARTPGAIYTVRVATEDLTVLAAVSGLKATEYQVPGAVLESLPAGSRILWQVEAVTPAGHRLSSRTFTARLD